MLDTWLVQLFYTENLLEKVHDENVACSLEVGRLSQPNLLLLILRIYTRKPLKDLAKFL